MIDKDSGWTFPDLTLDFAVEYFKSMTWVGTAPLAIATIEGAASMGTGYVFHAVWWWQFDAPEYPYGSAGFTEFRFLDTTPVADGYRVNLATEIYPRDRETVLPLGTIVTVRQETKE